MGIPGQLSPHDILASEIGQAGGGTAFSSAASRLPAVAVQQCDSQLPCVHSAARLEDDNRTAPGTPLSFSLVPAAMHSDSKHSQACLTLQVGFASHAEHSNWQQCEAATAEKPGASNKLSHSFVCRAPSKIPGSITTLSRAVAERQTTALHADSSAYRSCWMDRASKQT